MTKNLQLPLTAALLIAACAPATFAQSAEPDASTPPVETDAAHSDFNSSLTLYLWAVSTSGDVTTNGVTVSADASFIDVIDNADTVFGLMGAVDLQYKQLVFQIHPTWMRVTAEEQGAGAMGVPIEADFETDVLWFEGLAGWRFIDREVDGPESGRRWHLDGFVGGRVTYLETDLGLRALGAVTLPDGTVLPAGTKVGVSDSEAWFDPFIGARVGYDLSRTWTLELRADIGGFGVGSEFSWQAIAFLGWRFDLFGADAALLLGYRALGQDYQDNDFEWDVIAHGPAIGLNIRF